MNTNQFKKKLATVVAQHGKQAERIQSLIVAAVEQVDKGNLNWLADLVATINSNKVAGMRRFNRYINALVSGYSVKDGTLAKGNGKLAIDSEALKIRWDLWEPEGSSSKKPTFRVETRLSGILEKIRNGEASIEDSEAALQVAEAILREIKTIREGIQPKAK